VRGESRLRREEVSKLRRAWIGEAIERERSKEERIETETEYRKRT